ncbi:MAG: sigma-54-dependent transcriptional regulator [Bacteroidales bacterium]
MYRILIIDNDKQICDLLENYLKRHGFETSVAFSGNIALKKSAEDHFDIILCEFTLPDSDGMKILSWVRKNSPETCLIIMTAYANVRVAVKMIKAGAFDYVAKPVHPEEILKIVQKALSRNNRFEGSLVFGDTFITGKSKRILQVLRHIEAVAPTDIPVLIQGETGSGKEYIARAIHYASKRSNNDFVAVDCGALPKDLANSELFGHVKGAFTGAIYDKKGYFEIARGGTLFLDEIGNLPYENQAKILRALQEKVINRVGENKNIPVDVRIIVASNEDLMEAVSEGDFREDLYHRINGFKLILPALRERPEDILEFAGTFMKRANKDFNKNIEEFDERVKQLFLQYPWYGNIRELENMVKRAVLLAGGNVITPETLPEEIQKTTTRPGPDTGNLQKGSPQNIMPLSEALRDIEKETIRNALLRSKYNKSMAAKLLDIDRKTLYKKIREYNILSP